MMQKCKMCGKDFRSSGFGTPIEAGLRPECREKRDKEAPPPDYAKYKTSWGHA